MTEISGARNSSSYELPPIEKPEKKSTKNPIKYVVNKISQGINKKMGKSVGNQLLSTRFKDPEVQKYKEAIDTLKNEGRVEEVKIPSENGVSLDGMIFRPEAGVSSEKWIVVFNGMGARYEEHVEALGALAKDVGANVISFNYRGVGESDGRAKKASHLVADGAKVMEYLKDECKAEKENILLYGHSMGGGVAAEVKIQKENKDCSFVSESTFGSFKAAIRAKKGKVAAYVAEKSGWQFDNTRALGQMDPNKTLTIVHRQDPTIPYEKVSLYRAHKEELKKESSREIPAINRIKIGSKNRKIGEDARDIKSNPKIPKTKGEDRPVKGSDVYFKEFRKKGLVKYLYHPHHRIMDRRLEEEPKVGKKVTEADKESIAKINQQFRAEDNEAYSSMVREFKTMLGIKQDFDL